MQERNKHNSLRHTNWKATSGVYSTDIELFIYNIHIRIGNYVFKTIVGIRMENTYASLSGEHLFTVSTIS